MTPIGYVTARIRTHRVLGMRVVVAGTDQCVASLSNFAVGVAVARVAGIAALGAYSLAYVAWLAIADVHRSLVTDPMAIDNDLSGPGAARNVRSGLAAEMALGVGLSIAFGAVGLVLLLAGQHAYGVAFVALAPWLTFLLAQDYWRWVGFMKSSPSKALANDVVFDVVQALAFGLLLVIGVRSSVLAIGAWGIGALVASVFGLWQHRVAPTLRGGVGRIRHRWPMSSWLLAASLTGWGGSQAYVVLTGVLLGPAGLGGLRAAVSLVNGPSLVILQAGGAIGLPEASRALHARGWPGLRRVERVITGVGLLGVGALALVVLLFGRRLLEVLYGSGFGRFAPAADVLAIAVIVGAASTGAILSLKTTKQTGRLFRRGLVSLVVSIAAVAVLVPLFGLEGAAASSVVRSLVLTGSTLLLHWRYSRSWADAMVEPPPALPAPKTSPHGAGEVIGAELAAPGSGALGRTRARGVQAPGTVVAAEVVSAPPGWHLADAGGVAGPLAGTPPA